MSAGEAGAIERGENHRNGGDESATRGSRRRSSDTSQHLLREPSPPSVGLYARKLVPHIAPSLISTRRTTGATLRKKPRLPSTGRGFYFLQRSCISSDNCDLSVALKLSGLNISPGCIPKLLPAQTMMVLLVTRYPSPFFGLEGILLHGYHLVAWIR